MSTTSEKSQFRRLIGDYGKDKVTPETIEDYLDDAAREATEDFRNTAGLSAIVTDFDNLAPQFHTEIIYLAAINWWWQRAADLSAKHSQSVGNASQNVSEEWDRAIAMIEKLRERYDVIQSLGTDITFGNISRFSKQSLRRVGGIREEDAFQ